MHVACKVFSAPRSQSELYGTWCVLGVSRTGPIGSGSVGSGVYRA